MCVCVCVCVFVHLNDSAPLLTEKSFSSTHLHTHTCHHIRRPEPMNEKTNTYRVRLVAFSKLPHSILRVCPPPKPDPPSRDDTSASTRKFRNPFVVVVMILLRALVCLQANKPPPPLATLPLMLPRGRKCSLENSVCVWEGKTLSHFVYFWAERVFGLRGGGRKCRQSGRQVWNDTAVHKNTIKDSPGDRWLSVV